MDIDVFPARNLETVLRVLRTALAPEGALQPAEQKFLQTYATITGYALDNRVVAPIRACDVHVPGAHQQKRLVQLAAMAALLGAPVKAGSVAFVSQLAHQLHVADSVIAVLDELLSERPFRVRLLAMRRAFGALFKEAYTAEGPMGIVRFIGAAVFRTSVNRDKVWQYKRLGLLPEGTLGREYWKHLTGIGFGFPGEPGGIADSVAYHDIAHVLAGHDTSPEGEIQQGCFQGGNRRDDGFFFVQFAILQFHQGIRITPVAPAQRGLFDPEKVLWAIHRGASCTVDMTHQWNFWPLMPLPLQEARARCGLMPKPSTIELRIAA